MKRRTILIVGGILAAALLGSSATALALSTASRDSPTAPSRSSNSASRTVNRTGECGLNRLRVIRTSQTSGYGTFGTRSRYLVIRFVNVGPGCILAPGSGFALTASTNTHVGVHARLRGETLRVAPGAIVKLVLGTWWKTGAAPNAHYSCPQSIFLPSYSGAMAGRRG